MARRVLKNEVISVSHVYLLNLSFAMTEMLAPDMRFIGTCHCSRMALRLSINVSVIV